MKFHLVAQLEVAYLKDNTGDILRKYFSPKDHFFHPGIWDFEEFPKDFYLKTMNFSEFKEIIDKTAPKEDID